MSDIKSPKQLIFTPHPPETWAALKAEYTSGWTTATALGEKYGMAVSTITQRAKKENWLRPDERERAKTSAPLIKEKAVELSEADLEPAALDRQARIVQARALSASIRGIEALEPVIERIRRDILANPDSYSMKDLADLSKALVQMRELGVGPIGKGGSQTNVQVNVARESGQAIAAVPRALIEQVQKAAIYAKDRAQQAIDVAQSVDAPQNDDGDQVDDDPFL